MSTEGLTHSTNIHGARPRAGCGFWTPGKEIGPKRPGRAERWIDQMTEGTFGGVPAWASDRGNSVIDPLTQGFPGSELAFFIGGCFPLVHPASLGVASGSQALCWALGDGHEQDRQLSDLGSSPTGGTRRVLHMGNQTGPGDGWVRGGRSWSQEEARNLRPEGEERSQEQRVQRPSASVGLVCWRVREPALEGGACS